jgi:hypothetical protein
MNQRKAKEIRSIINPSDPIGKRNYRRAKKRYAKLSAQAKPLFIEYLREMMSAS